MWITEMMFRFFTFVAIAGFIFIGEARAAVTANSVITPQTPNSKQVQFLQGTDVAGTYKTLYTAGLNGALCKAIWVDNNDSVTVGGHLITLQIVNGGIKYGGPNGFSTTQSPGVGQFINQGILNATIWPGLQIDQNTNSNLLLNNGDSLQGTYATALAAGTQIDLHASCTDY